MTPITIALSRAFCEELAACEYGSLEDMQDAEARGENAERPTVSHAGSVAVRDAAQGRLVINTEAEALDMYWAVCSGVFKAKTPATYHAACRIADALREVARPMDPQLIADWPEPYREPFTGV